jgi:hypothetical protein
METPTHISTHVLTFLHTHTHILKGATDGDDPELHDSDLFPGPWSNQPLRAIVEHSVNYVCIALDRHCQNMKKP